MWFIERRRAVSLARALTASAASAVQDEEAHQREAGDRCAHDVVEPEDGDGARGAAAGGALVVVPLLSFLQLSLGDRVARSCVRRSAARTQSLRRSSRRESGICSRWWRRSRALRTRSCAWRQRSRISTFASLRSRRRRASATRSSWRCVTQDLAASSSLRPRAHDASLGVAPASLVTSHRR
jgi:hypothetical protein